MAAKIQDVGGEVEKRIYEGVDHASILAAYSVVFRTKKVGNKNPIFLDTVNFIQKHVSQDRVRAPH